MKILITEKQLKRLSEANTLLDNLNNRIDPNNFSYEFGLRDSIVIPHEVLMEGSIEDKDITVHVNIGEVIYEGQDVTQFAKNYVFWSGEGNDSELAYNYKMFIVKKINSLLRVTPIKITEWDVNLRV